MTCNNTRYTITILLLAFTLATIAHAHPYGSENLDNMDYNLFSNLGSHLEALAHNQFANMTTSPMAGSSRASASPHPMSQPQQPRSHPAPPQPSMNSNEYFSPWGMEFAPFETQCNHGNAQQAPTRIENVPNPTFVQERCATPENVHNTLSNHHSWFARLTHRNGRSSPELPAQSFTSQLAFAPVPAYTHGSPVPAQTPFVEGYQQRIPFNEYAPMQPQSQPPMDRSLMSYFPELEQAPHQSHAIPVSHFDHQPSTAADSVPHIFGSDVTDNPNYHPGLMNRAVGNMLGWVRRAPTIGDRSVPALKVNTNLLAPPDVSSLHRSPSSASSAGSSGRSPSRRTGFQRLIGDLHCHHCNAAFNTQGDLTHHLRSHQPYSNRNHVCPQCQKRFQYRKDLARHLPRHDPNRPKYYCSYPGCKYNTKGFGRQDHLDRHLNTQHNRIDSPQASRSPSNCA